MSETKHYVPRSGVKRVVTSSGKELTKLSFRAEDLLAFIEEHTNARGYINLCISERRDVGKYGDTHCIWLDTWEPTPRAQPEQVKQGIGAMRKAADGDVPF